MNELKINAQKREITGRKVKNLLKENLVPAAVFGKDFPTVNITVNGKEFDKVFHQGGHSSVISVMIDGKPEATIINEVQVNPLNHKPIHVSFHKINLKEEIDAQIPVIVEGEEESQAIKEGNVLVQTIYELDVRCLPTDLPQNITLDISKLALGENITVGDIKLPKGVAFVHEEEETKNIVIVSITEPAKEEVVEPVVEEVPADAAATDAAKTDENKAEAK